MAIGRITGSMLHSNLTRHGVDLAFESNILYLDVTNQRVAIGHTSPETALHVNGTTKTTGLIAGGITYPAADGTVNQILATNGSGQLSFVNLSGFTGLTFVGDDSTGSTINTSETLKFAGGNNITTAVVDDVVTIAGTTNINVNEISSSDSSAIQINDAVNISGALSVDTIDTTTLRSNDSSAIQVEDTLNLSGSLVLQKGSGQCVFSDTYLTRNLQLETATNEVINIFVTVQTKSTLNKWYGQGSASCYVMSSTQSPYLNFQRGKIYRFNQSDSSNSNHPINIYYDESRSRAFPDFAGSSSYVTQVGTAGTSGAYTELYVDFPSRGQLFYQCQNHAYMGGIINVAGQGDPIQFVSDDSSGFYVGGNEAIKIAGGNSINTTATQDSTDTITIALSSSINVNEISSTDSSAIHISDAVNMLGNRIQNLGTPVQANDAATKNYVDSGVAGFGPGTVLEITAGTGLTATPTNPITSTGTISLDFTTVVARVVGDDSTGTDLRVGETIKIAGTSNISTAVSGDTLTITGPSLNDLFTVVGDDSTGTSFNNGETLKIAGTQNITTAVSGDTLTITGPDISSFITASSTDTLTNKTIDANGTGNSISNIEVADFAAGVIDTDLASVSESDDTLPSAKAVKSYIDAQNTAQAITFVGDDSTGTSVNNGETFKIAGTSNITTAVSGDTLTITGSKDIDINSISSTDSTAIQINDGINVSGTVTANSGLVANGITYPTTDGTANQVLVTNGSGTLSFTSLNSFAGITFVGDDSTGSTINTAETLRFVGATGITTSVVDDVVTITGPDLSSYLTNSTTTIVGDDSTGTTLNSGETIKFAGATGITTSVTGDTLTITGPDLSGYLTAVPKTIDINQISSGDSTAIQINDAVNILGTLGMNGNAITQLANPTAQQDAATKAYVDSQVSAASTSFLVADDASTTTTIDSGSTFQIVGAGSVTTSLSGDTITITGSGGATNFTFIGDDSTGTTLSGGDTLQVLGGEGISTAVLGNVLTITNTSTQMEIDGGSAYSIYNGVSEVDIDGGTA